MQKLINHLGFSLLEVIIAVTLFAASVTVILALLPSLGRISSATADTLAAQRLPDALQVELQRLGVPGLETLAAQVPVMNAPLRAGLAFAATHEGDKLESLTSLTPIDGGIPLSKQYFLVECWRFPDGPLHFESQGGVLALFVRVSWPYRLPGNPTPVDGRDRSHLVFTVALNP